LEIDRDQLRELLLWLWGSIEKSQRELNAYQTVVSLMAGMSGLEGETERLFHQALAHPSPALDARLQAVRDTIEKFLREETPDPRLLEFLRSWEPGGGKSQ
jgi:hypothetical protein